ARGNGPETVYQILNNTTSTWVIATTTATSYPVTGLSSLTPYTFGLRAIQAASDPESYSETITVSVTTLIDAPAIPSDVLLTNVSTSTAQLEWADNSGVGNQETSFLITRSTDGVSYATILTLDSDTVTASLTGLTPNQAYYFKVVAVNETESVSSDVVSTSTHVVSPASFAVGDYTASTASLSWTSNGNAAGTVYEILNNTTSTWVIATTTAASYTVTGLLPNHSYVFGLRASQSGVDSAIYSGTLTDSVTTSYDVPTAPTGLAFSSVTSSGAILTWSDTTGEENQESSMVVSRSIDDFTYSTVATLAADTESAVLSGLTPNTTYYFKVTATNSAGSSASDSIATTTLVMAPISFATSSPATIHSVSLSWGANGNGDETVYEILNNTTSTWVIATTTAASYTVTGLEALSTYQFGVRAQQRGAGSLIYSAEVTLEETTLPNVPSAVTGIGISDVSTSTMRLSWQDNSTGSQQESGVELLQSSDDISYSTFETYAADTENVSLTGLEEGVRYFFKVRALNASGSATSIAFSTTTLDLTPTLPPSAFTAEGSAHDVFLSWENPTSTDFDSVTVRRGTAGYPTSPTDGYSILSASTATSVTDESLEDGVYYYSIFAFDTSGNISSAATVLGTVDSVPPVITAVESSARTVSSTISWVTDEVSTSRVVYSVNNSYASSTSEADLGGAAVLSHTVRVDDLLPCVTYGYKVVSRDLAGNAATSTGYEFTTLGCVGDAEIIERSSDLIPVATGGSISIGSGDTRVRLDVPIGYADQDASFQVKRLSQEAALAVLGSPTRYVRTTGEHLLDLRAFTEDQYPLRVFEEPNTIEISYASEDIGGLDESLLKIFRNDDGNWYELENCVVLEAENKVTCNTTHFSVFALFGRLTGSDAPSSAQSGSGALNFREIAPTSIQKNIPLSFEVNNGSSTTTMRVVRLELNGDPETVRGYAVSLDPLFKNGSILPLERSIVYELPSNPGLYTIYLRYFSTSGHGSPVLRRTIELIGEGAEKKVSASSVKIGQEKQTFKKNLSVGSTGEDVRRLQKFLNAQGYFVAKTGPGSPNNETVRYGAATKQALIRFQKAKKINPANGNLFDKTRSVINKAILETKQ
nr:fibronectin type III domain-containing protein [Patescibacteria group bacterium]